MADEHTMGMSARVDPVHPADRVESLMRAQADVRRRSQAPMSGIGDRVPTDGMGSSVGRIRRISGMSRRRRP